MGFIFKHQDTCRFQYLKAQSHISWVGHTMLQTKYLLCFHLLIGVYVYINGSFLLTPLMNNKNTRSLVRPFPDDQWEINICRVTPESPSFSKECHSERQPDDKLSIDNHDCEICDVYVIYIKIYLFAAHFLATRWCYQLHTRSLKSGQWCCLIVLNKE